MFWKNIFILLPLILAFSGCSIDPLESSQTEYYYPEGFEFEEGKEAGQKSSSDTVIGIEGIGLSFTDTKDQTVALGSKVDLKVNIDVADPTAQWSLYYTTDSSKLSGGVAILKSQSTSESAIKWDTSFVGAGTYQLVAMVETQGKFFLFRGSHKITVSGDFQELPEAAKISIVGPASSNVLTNGSTVNVSFEILDDTEKYTAFDVEFATDGANWQSVAANLTNSDPVAWTVPDALTASAKVRVIARLKDGSSSTIEQEEPFGISNRGEIGLDQVKPTIEAKCLSCHTGGGASGGFRLDSDDRIRDSVEAIWNVTKPDATLPMPPTVSNDPLTAEEQTLIALWFMSN